MLHAIIMDCIATSTLLYKKANPTLYKAGSTKNHSQTQLITLH